MQNTSLNQGGQAQLRVLDPKDAADLDGMDAVLDIEYLTIPGFLRRVPHDKPWGMQNVAKYGAQVVRLADGFGSVYRTALDPALGELRVFSLELLQKVYRQMSQVLSWPTIVDETPALENVTQAKEVISANERSERYLLSLVERVDSVQILNCIEMIREYLRAENDRLRREVEAIPAS